MDIDAIHKALANPVRRQILQWLKEPEQYFQEQDHPLHLGVCAGLIDRRLNLSQSTVSACRSMTTKSPPCGAISPWCQVPARKVTACWPATAKAASVDRSGCSSPRATSTT